MLNTTFEVQGIHFSINPDGHICLVDHENDQNSNGNLDDRGKNEDVVNKIMDEFLGKGNYKELYGVKNEDGDGVFRIIDKDGWKFIKMSDWVEYSKGKQIERADDIESLKKIASFIMDKFGTDVYELEKIAKKYFGTTKVTIFREFYGSSLEYAKYLKDNEPTKDLLKLTFILKYMKFLKEAGFA